MKKIYLFGLAIISIVITSCLKGKGVVPQTSTSLTGNWTIVNDSTTIQPWGLWAGNPVSGTNYVGKSTDYYKFTSNTVTFSENGSAGNATYAVKHNYLYMGFTNQYGKDTAVYTITNLTSQTVTLSGDTSVSPEQVFSHIINLKKVN